MAPPDRPSSHSGNIPRRSTTQPSTARSSPSTNPALCRAPHRQPVPLPQATGHIHYPSAATWQPTTREGQRSRENALQLTGMGPQTATSSITLQYPPNAVPPPYSTQAATAPAHTGAVLALPYSTSPVQGPTQLPPPPPHTEREQKRRKSSSSSPPTPSPTPPHPAVEHPNARRRQSQSRSDSAQYGSSPTT